MKKKLPMQKWVHVQIESELEDAEKNWGPLLDALDLELVPVRVNGQWTFYVQRKRRKKKALEEDVLENLQVWNSGMIFNLVDFAIALQSLREFIYSLGQETEKKPLSTEGGPVPTKTEGSFRDKSP